MGEIIFLLVLALVWIIFATIQDLKKREVANWLSFSLIIFALGFRFFYCLFSQGNFRFFYQGLIGLGIFFVIGNFLYYVRMFAGGDAKLMIGLGAVLPFSENFFSNARIFSLFFLIFLFTGAVYSLTISIVLSLRNFHEFKKEFSRKLKKNKILIYSVMFFGLVFMGFGLVENLLFYLGILIFIFPYFCVYAKAVDEACMIKKVKTNKLTEGDWLYNDLKIKEQTIKAKWDGLNKENIKLIRTKYQEIKIRKGIPFVPVFLISFLILIWFWMKGVFIFS